MPGELVFSFSWVGIENGEVAGTARSERMRKGLAGDLFEGMDHFEDGSGVTGAEIIGVEAGLQAADGSKVAAGKVDDVDKITLAGTVCSVVVVAEDTEFGEFAGGNFHDVWHEVVWDAVRIFAEEAGFVIADRIKIAKSNDVEIGVGVCEIFQDFFNHEFGLTVGVGDADAGIDVFGAFAACGLVAIDGGGG